MKKHIFWLFILIISMSVTYAINTCDLSPDEYILKCNFDKSLYERTYTCIDSRCNDKLYVYDEDVLVAEFLEENESIILYKNQINLNQISNHLNLVQILCDDIISYTILEVFDKKVISSKADERETFLNEPLVIEKFSEETVQTFRVKSKKYDKMNICYDYSYERYLDWFIETRTPNDNCKTTYDEKNTCYKQSLNINNFIKNSLTGDSVRGLYIIYSFILLFGIIFGLIGFTFYLFESRTQKYFFKLNKLTLFLMLIFLLPISFIWGKLVEKYLYVYFHTFNWFPAFIITFAVFITYIIASFLQYCFYVYSEQRNLKNTIHVKKILKTHKKRRNKK